MQDPMMMDMMMGDPFYFFKLKNRFLRIIHAFRNGPNGRGKVRDARALRIEKEVPSSKCSKCSKCRCSRTTSVGTRRRLVVVKTSIDSSAPRWVTSFWWPPLDPQHDHCDGRNIFEFQREPWRTPSSMAS